MAKYHRFLKDGYVVPFNELLVGNPLFQEFETKGDPHDPAFMAPQTDEDAEAQEAAALASAMALIAKHKAKAEAAKAEAAAKQPPK